MSAYKEIDSKIYEKAGDFNLPQIDLVSYKSHDGEEADRRDITPLVAEINIYESLFSNTLSGDMVLVDTFNLPNVHPILGFEKLEFAISSPGFGGEQGRYYDFTEESGHPVYVYNITNRKTINDRTQTYILHFCSREAVRNEQVRVSKAYQDSGWAMMIDLLRNKDYIDTKKPIFYEPSKELFKYVVPNIHPFEALRKIAKQSRPRDYDSAGYMFYEDAGGFKFRSIESMLAKQGEKRSPAWQYNYNVRNLPDPNNDRKGDRNKIMSDMSSINDFNVLSQSDTIKSIKSGVASSKLLTHDCFNKLFKEYDFDYNMNFTESTHTETEKETLRQKKAEDVREIISSKGAHSLIPWTKYDRDKFVTDHPDSVLFFKSSTEKIHDNAEMPPIENILQKRISQINAFDTCRVEITVAGFTAIRVGEKVLLNIQSIATIYKEDYLDKQLSGNYLIAKIRHVVKKAGAASRHFMVMELIKDSYYGAMPVEVNDYFTGREKDNSDLHINQYTLDKQVINK